MSADRQTDKEMSAFLDGISGVVEANSYEKMCLWQEYTGRGIAWEQRCDGLLETLGEIDGRPVCLSLTTANVDGHKLLFINATSQVVDHAMIDKWLLDTLPASARRKHDANYVNRVDAMNFCNVFRN